MAKGISEFMTIAALALLVALGHGGVDRALRMAAREPSGVDGDDWNAKAGSRSSRIEARQLGTAATFEYTSRPMSTTVKIGLVGDRSDRVRAHAAIPKALESGARLVGLDVTHVWLPTSALAGGVPSADHEGSSPGAEEPVIHRLSCALREDEREVQLLPGSRLASIYERETIREGYHCAFGVNPKLFQFELAALRGATPPIAVAFLRAAARRRA